VGPGPTMWLVEGGSEEVLPLLEVRLRVTRDWAACYNAARFLLEKILKAEKHVQALSTWLSQYPKAPTHGSRGRASRSQPQFPARLHRRPPATACEEATKH